MPTYGAGRFAADKRSRDQPPIGDRSLRVVMIPASHTTFRTSASSPLNNLTSSPRAASPDLLKDRTLTVDVDLEPVLFGQSRLDLFQRVRLGQGGQDPRAGQAGVRREGLVRLDGLAEVGEGVLLGLELMSTAGCRTETGSDVST